MKIKPLILGWKQKAIKLSKEGRHVQDERRLQTYNTSKRIRDLKMA